MNPILHDKLKDLLAMAEKHELCEVVWQQDEFRISFRRGASALEKPADEPALNGQTAPDAEVVVRSPMVGTFRRSLSKERPPVVVEGNHVKPGDKLGLVECMKIPTDVVSYCGGEIKKIMVEDGQPVEYGQPLFVIYTNGKASSNEK